MIRVKVNEMGYRIGDSHPRATIPDAVVQEARRLRETEFLTYAEIAARLCIVSVRTVEGLCSYRKRSSMPNLDPPIQRGYRLHRGQRR